MTKLKKKKQLGLDPGTASSRLKKELLFRYVKKAGDNFCFQCGAEIDSSEEMSVEHKTPWLDSENPTDLFFDLENIAFSHLGCNAGASRKLKGTHGSHRQYRNGCRCEVCTETQKLNRRKWREKKKQLYSSIGGAAT